MTKIEEAAVNAASKLLVDLGEEAVRAIVKRCAARAEQLGAGGGLTRCSTLARRLMRCANRGAK